MRPHTQCSQALIEEEGSKAILSFLPQIGRKVGETMSQSLLEMFLRFRG